jgi:hypothetical protein
MQRALALIAAVGAMASLAACGKDGQAGKAEQAAEAPTAASPVPAKGPALAAGETTPNAERVATIGLLNKRNNITRDLVIKVGEQAQAGNVIVRVQSCERTAPWEMPEETGAFVQVLVNEPPRPGANPAWRRVFSGWLFKNSPALNVVEHPVYDVWVKACAMNFPGEEAKPAAPASPRSAPNASGNGSGPPPAAAPSPTAPPTPAAGDGAAGAA